MNALRIWARRSGATAGRPGRGRGLIRATVASGPPTLDGMIINMTNNGEHHSTPLLQVDDRTGTMPDPVDGQVGRVVVVGAGIAGLTAARALHLSGVDVVVLEGRRARGRTHPHRRRGWSCGGPRCVLDPRRRRLADAAVRRGARHRATRRRPLPASCSAPRCSTAWTARTRTRSARLAERRAGGVRPEPGRRRRAPAEACPSRPRWTSCCPPSTRSSAPTSRRCSRCTTGEDADDLALGTFASFFFSGGVEDTDVLPGGWIPRRGAAPRRGPDDPATGSRSNGSNNARKRSSCTRAQVRSAAPT